MKSKVCILHAEHDLRIEDSDVPNIGPNEVLVRIGRGGICGSDLHYYQSGGFGPIRVMEPIILGHEIAGTVSEIGVDVKNLSIKDQVAINPSNACLECIQCKDGQFQHCIDMQFLGSARTMPHVQGGFREMIVIDSSQCYKVEPSVSMMEAACAEPLAVCLHASKQAGEVVGKRILITGAGPIGSLCAAVSALKGAKEIVVTDLHDFTLAIAKQLGATQTVNVGSSKTGLDEIVAKDGPFDLVFECSASEPAIHSAIQFLRPRGKLIQVGVAGNLNLPISTIVGKEIEFKGTHRFHPEFKEAVEIINKRQLDLAPLITHSYPVDSAVEAFTLAADRSSAMKVQLTFES